MCVFCTFYYISDVSKVSVLVPGAGLGRLAWEIARLGYTCQGNEWSFFMLFSSNFILNRYKTFCHSCDSAQTYLLIHICKTFAVLSEFSVLILLLCSLIISKQGR